MDKKREEVKGSADPTSPQSSAPLHQMPLETGMTGGSLAQEEEVRRAYLSDLDAKFAKHPSLPAMPELVRRAAIRTRGSHSSPLPTREGFRGRLTSFWLRAVRVLVTWRFSRG